ncbi:hypothetical protein HMPREF3190_00657 [Umbribacter vaginalis]|nr:hypothetical protein HMPREF3190_00657 [Coriobacteriales bacterium DNF00809]
MSNATHPGVSTHVYLKYAGKLRFKEQQSRIRKNISKKIT